MNIHSDEKTEIPEEIAFNIQNLGPIKTNSQIVLKPLTLMCGPNNAGKTWVMYAIYGFLNRFLSDAPLPGLNEITRKLSEQGEYHWNIIDWLDKNGDKIIDIFHQGMRFRLTRIFNSEKDFFPEATFDWIISKKELILKCRYKALDFRLQLGREKNDALRIYKAAYEDEAQLTLTAQRLPDLRSLIADALTNFMLDLDGNRQVFLMPAERNGLHLFFRELASARTALLHHAAKPDIDVAKLIKDVMTSRYAEPIADYIDWLNILPQLRKQKTNPFHDWAEGVKKIAEGKYEVDNEGNIFFIPGVMNRNSKGAPKLNFHMTSSTVKSLFGLWCYLEHEAKPGDTLMIDEPELNLHPDNQRKVAKLVVQLVNSGLRVVISTHSDYFVREINNLIMLSTPFEGRNRLIKEFKYEGCAFLKPDQVAAYLFDQNKIEPMEIDRNEGIIATTFDTVTNSLNRSNNKIFYSLRDAMDTAEENNG